MGWESSRSPSLALGIGGRRSFALLDSQALAAHVEKSGLPWAGEELLAGIVRARDAWRYAKHQAPRVMITAIDNHWARVPILRDVGF
jgi:hypothetical protein